MTERNSFDRFRQTFDIEDPAFAEQFEDVLDYFNESGQLRTMTHLHLRW